MKDQASERVSTSPMHIVLLVAAAVFINYIVEEGSAIS
jgi:hypothetical protein